VDVGCACDSLSVAHSVLCSDVATDGCWFLRSVKIHLCDLRVFS
jgi:hypothetical protein